MTDKEKRELKEGVISIFKRFNILDHTATIGSLRDDILKYINSLQEEHVSDDLEEVDLEKELKTLDNTLFDLDGIAIAGTTSYLTVEDLKTIAKHFFELGLAQKG